MRSGAGDIHDGQDETAAFKGRTKKRETWNGRAMIPKGYVADKRGDAQTPMAARHVAKIQSDPHHSEYAVDFREPRIIALPSYNLI